MQSTTHNIKTAQALLKAIASGSGGDVGEEDLDKLARAKLITFQKKNGIRKDIQLTDQGKAAIKGLETPRRKRAARAETPDSQGG